MVTLVENSDQPEGKPQMACPSPRVDNSIMPLKKKRRVNFNLSIDIKQTDDACVPTGPNSLSDFSDVDSLSEPIPTTPGGKPQVNH